MVFLWSPYDRDNVRVRRNPNASVPICADKECSDDWAPGAVLISQNGYVLGDATDDAMAVLARAGTRGATAIGAVAGFLFATKKIRGAVIGGVLGYFGGRYVVNMADKAVTAMSTIAKIEKAAS